MAAYPTSITHEQLGQVCDVLGIPRACVARLVTDVREGVTVTVHVRDKTGSPSVQGDQILTTEIHIPIGGDSDAAARA